MLQKPLKTLCRTCHKIIVDCYDTKCENCEFLRFDMRCAVFIDINKFCQCNACDRTLQGDFYKDYLEVEKLRQENILLALENAELKRKLEEHNNV